MQDKLLNPKIDLLYKQWRRQLQRAREGAYRFRGALFKEKNRTVKAVLLTEEESIDEKGGAASDKRGRNLLMKH